MAESANGMPAFVGIGSNLGDSIATVTSAVASLAALGGCELVAASSAYRSEPLGAPGQSDYINAAAELRTSLAPHDLLAELQQIEAEHGRVRTNIRWGPRTLDLDLLVFGDVQIADSKLILPHPGIAQRNFVLLPLIELAPELDVPGRGSAKALLAALGQSGGTIEKLGTITP